jgi:hypothetical protein
MLQWFVHVCCKRLFLMFHLFFRCMLQVCLSGCCICFTHMLQLFYLDVAYVLQLFSSVFHVSYVCFKCFICLLLYIRSIADFLKLDQVLHMGCM